MIELKVEEYCHNCPYFEAEVESFEKLLTPIDSMIVGQESVHNIRCIHAHRCYTVKKYYEEKERQKIRF